MTIEEMRYELEEFYYAEGFKEYVETVVFNLSDEEVKAAYEYVFKDDYDPEEHALEDERVEADGILDMDWE